MKWISIQVQPNTIDDEYGTKLITNFVKALESKGTFEETEIEVSPNKEEWVNINIKSKDLINDWNNIIRDLLNNTKYLQLNDISIVVCEGENGWEDYKLLHHFDSSEKLDTL